MDYVLEKDNYEIRIASLVSNVDKDVIIELYQPLIGSLSTMLYLTLLKQKRNEDGDVAFSMNQLFSSMQISSGQFLEARHSLEGVGLLRTYKMEQNDCSYYIFVIYAPKSPKDFFDDVLFKGLIIQYLGEKEARRLAFHYHLDLKIGEQFKEISASFVDVFNPYYDDASFKKNIQNDIIGHDSGRVKINFSYDLFFKYIEENSSIKTDSFSKKDLKEIERLSALFGLNEKTMAFIIIDEYHSEMTPHINFENVFEKAKDQIRYPFLQKKILTKSSISGDGVIAQKIKMMDRKSPVEWLKILQNNTKPASSDIDIVNSLSANYGFSNGVINVLIDYALHKNNNVLSKNYCEKIASSLAREGVNTTIEAMNYLNNNVTKQNAKKVIKTNDIKPVEEKKEEIEDNISEQEMNDIFLSIEKHHKGG